MEADQFYRRVSKLMEAYCPYSLLGKLWKSNVRSRPSDDANTESDEGDNNENNDDTRRRNLSNPERQPWYEVGLRVTNLRLYFLSLGM